MSEDTRFGSRLFARSWQLRPEAMINWDAVFDVVAPDIEAEREAFEEWYEGYVVLEHSDWFKRDGDGDYEMDEVGWAWAAWKAKAQR